MPKQYLFKVLTAGEGGVGKTTLLRRYIEGHFIADTKLTVGVEFFAKELTVDETLCTLQLWDFGGQERFRFMLRNYVRGAKGALLMFDLTRIDTLRTITEWVEILRSSVTDLPILFVGTKLDLETEGMIDDDYIEMLREENDLFDFIKISSKTGENVELIIETLVKKMLSKTI